ncbi:MAG: glycerophosphodiester phosphodiesterase family protein [Syntrophotaleaceae bacterium]
MAALRRSPGKGTLAAFRAAEADGADGVELDVQLSRDGVPVVLHDDTVDRTTHGQGAVRDLTLAELRQLDAGAWFDAAFAGESIPTLEEVLVWGGDRLRLNIEIKDSAAGMAVLDLAACYSRVPMVVSSFDHDLLAVICRKAPNMPLAFLWEQPDWRGAVKRAAACRAASFHPRFDCLTAELVAACHRHNMAVFPWTVDEIDALERCRLLAVDGIFCNDPARAKAWQQGKAF